ncbi:MAG: response regulator transcription factor [Ruminococcaceae bacterium]|nr:response regulator transcription factor [Oscillospiraceae bacterium]
MIHLSVPEQIKILVADDEERIRKIITDFLTREGYTVIEASNGAQALKLCSGVSESDKPDLVILDIMMPVMDGLTVLEELRRTTDIPVILLTAKSSESDQLGGFRMGADDYITKPFSPSLLVVRVQAILRRRGKLGTKRIQCGNVHIDEMAHAAYLGSEQLELTPKEYDLLLYFIENKGIALSREKILNGVWNYDYFGDLRTVDTHVKQLRAKLKDSGDMIVTVRGVGYRLEVR